MITQKRRSMLRRVLAACLGPLSLFAAVPAAHATTILSGESWKFPGTCEIDGDILVVVTSADGEVREYRKGDGEVSIQDSDRYTFSFHKIAAVTPEGPPEGPPFAEFEVDPQVDTACIYAGKICDDNVWDIPVGNVFAGWAAPRYDCFPMCLSGSKAVPGRDNPHLGTAELITSPQPTPPEETRRAPDFPLVRRAC